MFILIFTENFYGCKNTAENIDICDRCRRLFLYRDPLARALTLDNGTDGRTLFFGAVSHQREKPSDAHELCIRLGCDNRDRVYSRMCSKSAFEMECMGLLRQGGTLAWTDMSAVFRVLVYPDRTCDIGMQSDKEYDDLISCMVMWIHL